MLLKKVFVEAIADIYKYNMNTKNYKCEKEEVRGRHDMNQEIQRKMGDERRTTYLFEPIPDNDSTHWPECTSICFPSRSRLVDLRAQRARLARRPTAPNLLSPVRRDKSCISIESVPPPAKDATEVSPGGIP